MYISYEKKNCRHTLTQMKEEFENKTLCSTETVGPGYYSKAHRH